MRPAHRWWVAILFIASAIISGFARPGAEADIAGVLLPFSGALTGIILATIGIVMGSVGSIYAAVAQKRTPENADRIEQALAGLDAMVRELKDDCLLVIGGFSVLLGCYFLARIDVPGIVFPSLGGIGKLRVLESFCIFFVALSLWAIFDTVTTVFSLHAHAALLARHPSGK